jgi:hypothetical protein
MRSHLRLLSVAALAGSALAAHAVILLDTGMTSLNSGDPTELGRLSRSGVASDWSAVKAFPGVINTGTSYHYRNYDVSVGLNNYVQVSIDDADAVIFTSAYAPVYNPGSMATGYMGDAGSSGNPFGNMGVFQVVAPVNGMVTIHVGEVLASGGALGHNYRILVEGFSDTEYNEAVPEPATLSILGLGALAAFRRRKA